MATSSRITTTHEGHLYEDQIRNYQRNARRKYMVQKTLRTITGNSKVQTLEQQINPDVQLRNSMAERANIAPAEVLYKSRNDEINHRVYIHRSEESMLILDDHQEDRALIQEASLQALERSGMRYIHLGIIQVRIQILHRTEEGTMALVVFRDTRWKGDQAIFATMEVDL